MRSICAILLLFALSSAASAQSATPVKPVDQSIAGNTQQAAGQLAEINKKLELIIQRMDDLRPNRPPFLVPSRDGCQGAACNQSAAKLCTRFGYAHAEVISAQATSTSSWVCYDGP